MPAKERILPFSKYAGLLPDQVRFKPGTVPSGTLACFLFQELFEHVAAI